MSDTKKPPISLLKPIHLYDAVLVDENLIQPFSAVEPRYIVVYAHIDREQALAIKEVIDERLKSKLPGTINIPLYGYMV